MVIFFVIINISIFSQSNIIEYKVKSGDSFFKISKKYDISVDDIKEYNGLISNTIYIGQVINRF